MTPRTIARRLRAAALLVAAAGLVALSGCDPRTMLFFLQPNDPVVPHPADAPDLKGKRVAIITHAAVGSGEFLAVDREIGKEVGKILKTGVKKIDLIPFEKVASWSDAHPGWTDPSEVGKAYEADVVIFLEVQGFEIDNASSPGLLQGVAQVNIQAIAFDYPKDSKGWRMKDKPKESEVVFSASRTTEFPNRGHMALDAGVSRGGFKNKFVKLVATEISWNFIDHAPGDDIQDTKIYN